MKPYECPPPSRWDALLIVLLLFLPGAVLAGTLGLLS